MATIEVTEQAQAQLRELAQARGEPDHVTAEKAFELLRRQTLFDQADAAYARLQADPEAWASYQAELAAWDATVADGLEAE